MKRKRYRIKPKKKIVIGVMAILLIGITASGLLIGKKKSDDENWAERVAPALESAQTLDTNKGLANRDEVITRGQAAVLVSDLLKLETKSRNVFMDLDDAYYTDGILKLVAVDGINSDKDKKIKPKAALTVEDAVNMVAVIVEDRPDDEMKQEIYDASGLSQRQKDKEVTAGEFMTMLDDNIGGHYSKGGKVENKKFQKPVLVSGEPVEFSKCQLHKGVRVTSDINVSQIKLTEDTEGKISQIKEGKELNEDAPYEFSLSSYDTKFDPTMENRCDNLKLALSSIEGTIVEPGQSFSFNEATGKKSYARGYKDGIVVSGGKLVPGLAGGVCQASSTVWNAAIESGVAITERHAHSLEFSYVPPGRDATIYDGVHDLRFKNTYPVPVMIKTKYDDKGVLTVGIYSQEYVKKPEIEIVTTKTGEYSYITERKVDGVVDYKHTTKYEGFGF